MGKKPTEIRRIIILETLLSVGDSSEREVMQRLWREDYENRESRYEPFAWYYNVTKYFAPMKKAGLIEMIGLNDKGRKTWRITPLGINTFLNEVAIGAMFSDPLFANNPHKIEEILLLANA